MNPEAVAFADNYGFIWKTHAIGHANRKAGKERNFWTVQTSFMPGRTFSSLEDFNRQAVQWATVRYALRPQSKTKLIPVELFEKEKCALIKLPDFVTSPYLPYRRKVDEYGHCSFDGNFYWVPESVSSSWVTVLEYAHDLRIMDGTQELIRYRIAPDGVKNQIFVPPGHKNVPRGVPQNRKLGCEQEEQRLRELGEPLVSYLDMVRMPQNGVRQCLMFISSLYSLLKQIGPTLLRTVIERALSYRVFDRSAIERMVSQIVTVELDIACDDIAADYRKRPSYRKGQYNGREYNRLQST